MTAVCPACDLADLAQDIAAPAMRVTLSVPDIKCAVCIGKIEGLLNVRPEVRDARVNLTLKRVSIETEHPAEQYVEILKQAGYEAFAFDPETLSGERDPVGQDLLLSVGVAGFAMMNVMLLSVAVWSGAADATRDLFHLISAAIALPAALFAGQPFFRSAWAALRHRRLNMDVPISLAILLAGGMSLFETLNGGAHAYFDAALSLTFFLLIGRVLEHKTRATARSAAKDLSALEVHTAQRLRNGQVEKVLARDLVVGDTVLVPTGVRVPVDGQLSTAVAATDQSFLTGESAPVDHAKGAILRAGEINLGAPFEMVANAVGEDTRLRQMARLVETAETVRNRYTSLADRVAGYYAPVVHLLAAATFTGWFVATGDVRYALNVAIAVLIITCPCALGLAVPAVSTAAIGALYRLGFLVKSGTALERLAQVDRVLLDKTGTLTRPGFDFDLALLSATERSIAKALAQASSHPVSQALSQYLGETPAMPLDGIEEVPGEGMRARWGEVEVALGNAGGFALTVGARRIALSYSELDRPGADGLQAAFEAAGITAQIMSGDTEAKTQAMAQRLSIPRWQAAITPEGKYEAVRDLTAQGAHPCMIGDGINDAAALQAAHASVAPGSGLDAARSASDVVMLGDTLSDLPKLFGIARKATRLYRQNFAIAFVYNAIAIPFALSGQATPLMAAIAMSTSSIIVLLNASRARSA